MKNLAKVLLYSILIFLFALTTPTAVIAGGHGTANVYLEDKDSIDIMGNDSIEFAYSPMTALRLHLTWPNFYRAGAGRW